MVLLKQELDSILKNVTQTHMRRRLSLRDKLKEDIKRKFEQERLEKEEMENRAKIAMIEQHH